MVLLYLLIPIFLFSCSESTLEDFRESGRSQTRTLLKKLENIQSKEDLLANEIYLENLFFKISDLMIRAKQLQDKASKSPYPLEKEDLILSDRLRNELNRIFQMPGAKKIIEKTQEKALNYLNLTEQQLEKRNLKK